MTAIQGFYFYFDVPRLNLIVRKQIYTVTYFLYIVLKMAENKQKKKENRKNKKGHQRCNFKLNMLYSWTRFNRAFFHDYTNITFGGSISKYTCYMVKNVCLAVSS